jgi:hypothetical protein
MFPNSWSKENAGKLLDSLDQYAVPGQRVEYFSHPDYWLMLAVNYKLKMCEIGVTLPMTGDFVKTGKFTIGTVPRDDQPVGFEMVTRGDDILLTVAELRNRFDYPVEDIVAPAVPEGKRLYVRMAGQRILHFMPVAITYGDNVEALFMDYADECRCCISHSEKYEVGDNVENPFSDIPYEINVVK